MERERWRILLGYIGMLLLSSCCQETGLGCELVLVRAVLLCEGDAIKMSW